MIDDTDNVNLSSLAAALLNAMMTSGDLGIVGAMYGIETGKVKFYSDG